MSVTECQGLSIQNEPNDTCKIAYMIHFLLGAGYVVPWHSFITAADYFESMYPNKHIDKFFSVAYMSSSLLVLILLMCLSSWKKLPSFKIRMNFGLVLFIVVLLMAPITDWISNSHVNQRRSTSHIAFVILIFALAISGVAGGITAGSLVGATGALPGRYMQAVFAGKASSGILVCLLRIITKASLQHAPRGLRLSTRIYFIISIFIIIVCIISCNLMNKLQIIQHYKQLHVLASQRPESNEEASTIKPRPGFWKVVRRIKWQALGVVSIYTLTLSIFPGYLTENVNSKIFKDWYPILLITTFNIAEFLGKSITSVCVPVPIIITRATWACQGRLLMYPLFAGCLHGPKWLRSEAPVAVLTGVLWITNGYLTSVLMILTPKIASVEESESAGIAMVLFLNIGLAIGSVIGWTWDI